METIYKIYAVEDMLELAIQLLHFCFYSPEDVVYRWSQLLQYFDY